jgi:2-haloalkanoic acid dehalogenase type II
MADSVAHGPTLTFDIFGTVLDWRTGLARDCAALGRPLAPDDFDRIIDRQAQLESGPFVTYAEITRQSLVDVLGLDDRAARHIGASVGHWPLYPDSAAALRKLMTRVRCVAMTNSDRSHGDQVQAQLGFRMNDWVCAEDVRLYKPDARFWRAVAERGEIRIGNWWHVSAYADYDLAVANGQGLTTVFVARPHARPGDATHHVDDLHGLLPLIVARS